MGINNYITLTTKETGQDPTPENSYYILTPENLERYKEGEFPALTRGKIRELELLFRECGENLRVKIVESEE